MLHLPNQVYVEMLVEGRSIPDSTNFFSDIALTEGNNAVFPCAELWLNDQQGNLAKDLNLVDGTSLSITVGKDPEDVSTMMRQYRVFGTKRSQSAFGPQLKVVCVYDAPLFTTASVRESYKGTSSEVLKQIADKCKLQYEGPNKDCNDEQIWLNICKNRAMFVQQIARHGYIDQHSCLSIDLTSLGILKYKDWLEEIHKKPKYKILFNVGVEDTKKSTYLAMQARASSKAGVTNNWANYGYTNVEHSLTGDLVENTKVDVKAPGYLQLNTQIASTVDRARVDCTVLDCGNVHQRYNAARYQNIRFLSLFSERLSIMTLNCTDIQLYDVVEYRQSDADIDRSAEPTDIYLVVGKTLFVKGAKQFAERIELARMSVTNTGATKLATKDPYTARSSTLPESIINTGINAAKQALAVVQTVKNIYTTVTNLTLNANSLTSLLINQFNLSVPNLSLLTQLLSGNVQNYYQLIPNITALNQNLSYVNSTTNTLTGLFNQVSNLVIINDQTIKADSNYQTISNARLQQTALFSPTGPVRNLAQTLPLYTTLLTKQTLLSTIQSVGDITNTSNYDDDPEVISFNQHLEEINTNMLGLWLALTNLWNTCISISLELEIPSDLSIYKEHNILFLSLIDTSLSEAKTGGNKVYPITSLMEDISSLMNKMDGNRKPMWLDPNTLPQTYDVNLTSLLSQYTLKLKALQNSYQENSL